MAPYWAGRTCSDSMEDDAGTVHDFNAILTRYKKMHLGSFSRNCGPVVSVRYLNGHDLWDSEVKYRPSLTLVRLGSDRHVWMLTDMYVWTGKRVG